MTIGIALFSPGHRNAGDWWPLPYAIFGALAASSRSPAQASR